MRKTRIAARLTAASIGLTCAATAQAGFINEALPETAPAAAAAVSAPDVTAKPLERPAPVSKGKKVTEIGFSPNDLYMPRGQGRNVALSDMLPVVVPHDFSVNTSRVDPTLPVTWSGGLPWDTVLTNALAPLADVHVTFDWNAHTVTLYRTVAHDTSLALATTPAPAPIPASAPVGAPSGEQNWTVSPSDGTLRHALAKWAVQAGWQLVWDASVDVPVTVSASFTGDFRYAVKALFSSLSAADVNLSGLMYTGNRVLRVTETGQRAQ